MIPSVKFDFLNSHTRQSPFVTVSQKGKPLRITEIKGEGEGGRWTRSLQKMLDENQDLIQSILDYQSKSKMAECIQNQQILHWNLV
uniref:SS18 N-terminal domain-containing protein n=1 Tax=Catagonus wagneri TaxID=51154 RepID=A0A8C3VIY4_9CETA